MTFRFYAVKRGRNAGVYDSLQDVQEREDGLPSSKLLYRGGCSSASASVILWLPHCSQSQSNNRFAGFHKRDEAELWISGSASPPPSACRVHSAVPNIKALSCITAQLNPEPASLVPPAFSTKLHSDSLSESLSSTAHAPQESRPQPAVADLPSIRCIMHATGAVARSSNSIRALTCFTTASENVQQCRLLRERRSSGAGAARLAAARYRPHVATQQSAFNLNPLSHCMHHRRCLRA
jgi:hypothetical protein